MHGPRRSAAAVQVPALAWYLRAVSMKTSLGHLPPHKQEQLRAIAEVLVRGAPVELLILFGSHARGDQVEDPVTGYVSDYDLLAIVETERQAEDHALWEPLIARARALAGGTPVALIAHDVRLVNHEIRVGQYFFADIVNEGILLHDSKRYQLARPKALNDAERLELAERNFRHWFGSASEFWRGCRYYAARGLLNHAAFLLHQAAERYFHALLLVWTGYKPRSHDIELLGTQAAAQHGLLVGALPNTEPEDQRLFKLLKKAYIDSRYAVSYRITAEELAVLQERVRLLGERVRTACLERLASFRGAAAVPDDLPQVPTAEEELVAEGKAEGMRESLKVILAARGVAVPPEAMAQIEGTQDVGELRRWTERAATATTWEDLLRAG